jgi:hypothetical protein
MTSAIMVRNRIAQTSNLRAQMDIGTMGAVRTANLVNEALNMRLTAVLSHASSQKVGGQNINLVLEDCARQRPGELVIPALRPAHSQISFAPDVQQLAQMKLKG